MAFGKYIKDFANYTTLAGFPRIIDSKATSQRIAWIIIFSVAWLLFTIQMSFVLQSYFEYPKKLRTSLVHGGVPFPAITLCNLGSFDFYTMYRLSEGLAPLKEQRDKGSSALNKTNEGTAGGKWRQQGEDLLANSSHLNDTFIRAMYKYYRVMNKSSSLNDTEWKIYYDKMFSRTTLAANVPTEMLSANGVQENEFIVKCIYRNKPCTFKKIFDPYFFNCYTFTAPNVTSPDNGEPTPLFEGIENGFTVMLLAGTRMLKDVLNPDFTGMPGIYAKDSALSGAGGVRVVIHPPGTRPFPLTEGYDIPPGQMASLGLTPKRRMRLGQPHGHCNHKYPFLNGEEQELAGPYRKTACEKVCIQNHIYSECNCYENTLPTENDLLPDDDVMSLNDSKGLNTSRKKKNAMLQEYCFSENYLEGERNGSKEDPCKRMEKCSGTNEFHKCFKFYSHNLPMCDDEMLIKLLLSIKCSEKAKYEAMSNATLLSECKCHPSCNDVLYNVSYSLSQWPSQGIDGDAVDYEIRKEIRYINKFSSQKKRKFYEDYRRADIKRALKDFSKINVYVADSDVFLTMEVPAMTVTQLISDVGGQLGVWIGVSVITLAEVLELFILMFTKSCREKSKEDLPNDVKMQLNSEGSEEV